jgi:hypothetical protein
MRTQKRRIPVVVAGPHRKHPAAGRVTSPLHMLADAKDQVASEKVEKRRLKSAEKIAKNVFKASSAS